MASDLVRFCAHDISLTGAEGPISALGRFPILWRCDDCAAILRKDTP